MASLNLTIYSLTSSGSALFLHTRKSIRSEPLPHAVFTRVFERPTAPVPNAKTTVHKCVPGDMSMIVCYRERWRTWTCSSPTCITITTAAACCP